MLKAVSRVVSHARVARLFHSHSVRLVCLLALAVVALLALLNALPPLCRHHGYQNGIVFDIPYRSNASTYRQKARYVTTLPRGNLDIDEDAPGEAAATPPPSQQQWAPRGVHTRAQRQEALEEEIDKYLVAHGIHRERRTRVRFHAVSNFFDWRLCTTFGAAALGGMSFTVSAFDEPHSNIGRFTKYVEFADRKGLDDDDIIVTTDSDVIWSGVDVAPFLSKFARFSPATEADLDVAAVRAWEDYGERKAPLFMKELQAQANGTGGDTSVKRPDMQMAPVLTNGEHVYWWGQRSEGYVPCGIAHTLMDHLIKVARNHVSSYDMNRKSRFISGTGDRLRAEVSKIFPGASRWMVDDVLRQPNASSPYTTKAQRDPNDPLFYHPFINRNANPTTLVNTGLQVSRVWALKRLVEAMAVFGSREKPVPHLYYFNDTRWKCDQGTVGELYTRSRLFEVEHNLLTGPPLSARTPRVQYDPRFGLPGLIGVDRRTEMAVLGGALRDFPKIFHHSTYLDRHFPTRDSSGVNITEVHLGSSDPKGERLGALSETHSGALVTPPLVWRSASVEDATRGYVNTAESDPDIVHPPFIHYAGPRKDRVFCEQRHLYSWLVAARHDRRARQALDKVLREELVELWYQRERVYVDYLRMCKDPTGLPL